LSTAMPLGLVRVGVPVFGAAAESGQGVLVEQLDHQVFGRRVEVSRELHVVVFDGLVELEV